jgi:hypothetical protein
MRLIRVRARAKVGAVLGLGLVIGVVGVTTCLFCGHERNFDQFQLGRKIGVERENVVVRDTLTNIPVKF